MKREPQSTLQVQYKQSPVYSTFSLIRSPQSLILLVPSRIATNRYLIVKFAACLDK